MGMGYLNVRAFSAEQALPVKNANVTVRDHEGATLYDLTTDASGMSAIIPLPAPDATCANCAEDTGPRYSTGVVEVSAAGFGAVKVCGVQVFDGQTTLLPVEMAPAANSGATPEIVIPPHKLDSGNAQKWESMAENLHLLRNGAIPEYITVHLGAPAVQARNVRVKFVDYIKNTACGELCPTWPASALQAGVLGHVCFALNRIRTEWYRSLGYSFDITASPRHDLAYAEGRNLFACIIQVADEIFQTLSAGKDFTSLLPPQPTQDTDYCPVCGAGNHGSATPCACKPPVLPAPISDIPDIPLSMPADMAQPSVMQIPEPEQLNAVKQPIMEPEPPTKPLQIAQPSASQAPKPEPPAAPPGMIQPPVMQALEPEPLAVPINTVPPPVTQPEPPAAPPDTVQPPYPGLLREGSSGEDVRLVQRYLNEIARACPFAEPLREDGKFGSSTKRAVIAFQRMAGLTQDGQIGQITWNTLVRTHDAVK